jgi:dihydroneopterin aldolase
MPDTIHIAQLELSAHIGVPSAERAQPQRLTVSLTIEPTRGLSGLADEIENAVDYYAVTREIKALALERPRHLIETLAEEIAAALLERFAVSSVEIELRKYVLPDTEFVAVRIRRER